MTHHKWLVGVPIVLMASLAFLAARRPEGVAVGSQPPRKGEKPKPAGQLTPTAVAAEEKALRQAAEAFSAAFNKGDLDALMALWADGAEYIGEAGKTYRGKEAIRALLQKALVSAKGHKQTVKVHSIRFLRPDVALEEGTVTLTAPDGTLDEGRYSAAWVKADGKWLMSQVRDLPEKVEEEGKPAAVSKLRPLAWMVGDWQDKEGKGDVTITCRWAPEQTFLVQEFTARQADGKTLKVVQWVGWDAYNEQIRSWVFDSTGGFGESYWTREGNTWVLASEGILPDGRLASATNRWKYVDDNTVTWTSKDREADEQPLPDIEVTFVRKAKPR